MLTASVTEFLHEGDNVSDCNIVIEDGIVIKTHKLWLASRDILLKEILLSIPQGIDSVILMQDFSLEDVGYLFKHVADADISDEDVINEDFSDECSNTHDNIEQVGKAGQGDVETEQSDRSVKAEGTLHNKVVDRENELDIEINKNKTKSEVINDKRLKREMKRKLYEEAVSDFLSNKSPNLMQCAKKFGLPTSTLYDLVISNRGWIGRGQQSKVFENEEEVAKIVLEKTNDGKELSWPLLKQLLLDELEQRRSSNTNNRDMCRVSTTSGTLLNMSFVRRFAERNGLSKYLLKKFLVTDRPYQCERCSKSFIWKKDLVKHERTKHKQI